MKNFVIVALFCICSSAAGAATSAPSIASVAAKIQSAVAADLNYAKALADNAGTPGSKLRSQCLGAIITANEQVNGINLKNPDGTPMTAPNPDVISVAEQTAEVIDSLQPTSPVIAGCAAAANAAQMSALQFISTLLSAVAVKAAVPVLP